METYSQLHPLTHISTSSSSSKRPTARERRIRRVCVFCGSAPGKRSQYRAAAEEFARLLVSRGIGIVYGGGHVGLMGALADAAVASGGEVIGIIPRALVKSEHAHRGLTKLHIVKSMHRRKELMNRFSDAFVALPGAFGTFEEFFEVVTWAQLGIHNKPCGLLNVAHYFDPLLSMVGHAVTEGFMTPAARSIVIADDDPQRLLERITDHAGAVARPLKTRIAS